MSFKNGIIPKGNDAVHLRICKICGMKHFFYGSSFPGKNEKCDGCKFKKINKKKKRSVKRNLRIIKRGNK